MTNVQLIQITKICVDVFKDLLEKMAHQVSVTTAALLRGGTKSMGENFNGARNKRKKN